MSARFRHSSVLFLLVGTAALFSACSGKSDGAGDGSPQSGAGGTSDTSGATGGGSATGGTSSGDGGKGGTAGHAALGGAAGSGSGIGGTAAPGGSAGSDSGKGGAAGKATLGGSGGTDSSKGGASGNAGSGGSAGSAAGSGGVAGSGTCGPCPGVACGPPFEATVSAPSGAMISNLTATGDNGLEITCSSNGQSGAGCAWTCQSTIFQLRDGDYTVTFSAPGYDAAEVTFTVTNPTNCGCCGCPCHTERFDMVMLSPNGDDPGACCTSLETDAENCGSCGHACTTAFHCTNGDCVGPQGP